MHGFKTVLSALFGSVALLSFAGSAFALDPKTVVPIERAPGEVFSLGFKAYKRGEKLEAFEALRYAAEKGHAGARWKLGQMYAQGDGVPENDYEAFKIFEEIIAEDEDDTSSSPNAAYVASSVVALGDYMRTGIPGTPVSVDLPQARQLYFHAASIFGDPKAQFELGRMLLNGDGGRPNPRQAARWLKLSAEKGNTGAQALLGYLLFDGEKISLQAQPVRGLAMLTLALRHATEKDERWIRPLQEEVFSLASEGDRRTALAYAEEHQGTIAKN
ncbi:MULTISPECIES: tetratricopeptide repeat protein [unclassified Aureimonas]|uniref:tetratricopeptide repeat protein n=1 Tax=unclassified Aureimonas TaxID=2615206 RepID=UPI0006FD6DC7|nr:MULTISPECIES: tetratricopeptide repeat protein [unclassified Aureimonas]KQT60534.1 exopolysaccharide production negative regulator [Aureimonas sp. Leaf427]KQT79411.1 exopolysaccharide production negative regulator [Aureimonas sp. Leaf460]